MSIFFIDVVTAVIGIALLVTLAVPTIRKVVETGYFADMVEGIKYTFTHRFVRWLLILFAIVFVLTVAPSYLTPPHARAGIRRRGVDADGAGDHVQRRHGGQRLRDRSVRVARRTRC